MTRKKYENAVLILRLGQPSTLIRLENRALQKRSSDSRNLKTPGFSIFSVDGKHFEMELFENDEVEINI